MSHSMRAANQSEIIAVVLPDGTPEPATAVNDFLATGTMLMVRYADGRVGLEPVRREANGQARATATPTQQRQRRPIIDPVSREIVGYEMDVSELMVS